MAWISFRAMCWWLLSCFRRLSPGFFPIFLRLLFTIGQDGRKKCENVSTNEARQQQQPGLLKARTDFKSFLRSPNELKVHNKWQRAYERWSSKTASLMKQKPVSRQPHVNNRLAHMFETACGVVRGLRLLSIILRFGFPEFSFSKENHFAKVSKFDDVIGL